MTRKGVWDIQDVRDKLLAGKPWEFDQTIYNWGANNQGALGHNGPTSPSIDITKLPGSYNQASAGMYASLITKTDKTLWACGYNNGGILGQGSPVNSHRSSPVQIPGTTWAGIFTNGSTALATKTDGTMWAWGYNDDGQVGDSSKTNRNSPVQLAGTNWAPGTGIQYADQRKIAVGYMGAPAGSARGFSLAVKTDGSLWAWGNNDRGQLGQNNKTEYNSPVQVGSDTTWNYVSGAYGTSFGIKTDGTLWGWGFNSSGKIGNNVGPGTVGSYSSPVQIPGTSWSRISGGLADHAIAALRTDGTAWVWGGNNSGCLGQNQASQPYSSPKQIPGTWRQSQMGQSIWFGLKSDNTLWGCGSYFKLPNNDVYRSSPVQLPGTWYNDSALFYNINGWITQPNMTPSEL